MAVSNSGTVLETIGVIQVAGTLCQKSGVGHVEDLTFGMLEFLKGQGGLAAAGATDDHQGWLQTVNGLLGVVKRDRLVEQVNGGTLGVEVAQCLRLLDRFIGTDVGNLALVNRRTTQETRLIVSPC